MCGRDPPNEPQSKDIPKPAKRIIIFKRICVNIFPLGLCFGGGGGGGLFQTEEKWITPNVGFCFYLETVTTTLKRSLAHLDVSFLCVQPFRNLPNNLMFLLKWATLQHPTLLMRWNLGTRPNQRRDYVAHCAEPGRKEVRPEDSAFMREHHLRLLEEICQHRYPWGPLFLTHAPFSWVEVFPGLS